MKYIRNDFKKRKKKDRKSLYSAVLAALACVTVVGAAYYKMASDQKKINELAEQMANQPVVTAAPGNDTGENEAPVSEAEAGEESEQASTIMNATAKPASTVKNTDKKKKEEVKVKKAAAKKKKTAKAAMSSGVSRGFDEEKGLTWPVKGDVLMKFSQNNTIYFKTLAQYKSNPAVEISADEGTKVIASAAGTVKEIVTDDVTGAMVVTDIGNGYTVTYGQLKDIKVKKGDDVKEGQLLGLVAKPTKYFSEEGSNLYFQVKKDGTAVDPLLLLN